MIDLQLTTIDTTKRLRQPPPSPAINKDRSHRCFARSEIQDDFLCPFSKRYHKQNVRFTRQY